MRGEEVTVADTQVSRVEGPVFPPCFGGWHRDHFHRTDREVEVLGRGVVTGQSPLGTVPVFFSPRGPDSSSWGDSMGLFVTWVLFLAEVKSLSPLELPEGPVSDPSTPSGAEDTGSSGISVRWGVGAPSKCCPCACRIQGGQG